MARKCTYGPNCFRLANCNIVVVVRNSPSIQATVIHFCFFEACRSPFFLCPELLSPVLISVLLESITGRSFPVTLFLPVMVIIGQL